MYLFAYKIFKKKSLNNRWAYYAQLPCRGMRRAYYNIIGENNFSHV